MSMKHWVLSSLHRTFRTLPLLPDRDISNSVVYITLLPSVCLSRAIFLAIMVPIRMHMARTNAPNMHPKRSIL